MRAAAAAHAGRVIERTERLHDQLLASAKTAETRRTEFVDRAPIPMAPPSAPAMTSGAFDYSSLDVSVASEARSAAERIRVRLQTAYEETGRDLIAIKDRLGHGHFGAWLKAEFDMTERTAENYMNAAKLLEGKPKRVSELSAGAVYALAAPSAPREVVAAILAEVEAGATPKAADIRERVNTFRKEERKAAAAKTAEQIKQEREAEKRRKKREADRVEREKAEREADEARRNEGAREVAAFLAAELGIEKTIKLVQMMRNRDWYRISRCFADYRNGCWQPYTLEEIEATLRPEGEGK